MASRARARSPHSTAERVSRALGSAKVEVSCLHTRRQWVQAKRRTRTTNCVGLHPTGTWARRRATVPRDTPWAPQALQNESSNPIGMRHSITVRLAVRCWPTAVSPRAPRPRKVVRSGSVKVSLRHVEVSQVACVAAPIIGGPRPLPAATTHPPTPDTPISSTYYTPNHEEPEISAGPSGHNGVILTVARFSGRAARRGRPGVHWSLARSFTCPRIYEAQPKG